MIRKALEALRRRASGDTASSDEAASEEARASAAAEDCLRAYAAVGVTPNGGPQEYRRSRSSYRGASRRGVNGIA